MKKNSRHNSSIDEPIKFTLDANESESDESSSDESEKEDDDQGEKDV